MAITTSETLGGLKQTIRVCDDCGEYSGVLAGTSNRMLCDGCIEAAAAELAAKQATLDEHEKHAAAARAAQNERRRIAREEQLA